MRQLCIRRLPARLIALPLPWVVSATIHEVDMLATASTVMATNMPPSRSSSEFCSLFTSKRRTRFLHAKQSLPRFKRKPPYVRHCG